MHLDLDGVESKFLEHPFQFDLVSRDGVTIGFESRHDFGGSNATIKVTFVVRIGFDVDRLLGDLIGKTASGDTSQPDASAREADRRVSEGSRLYPSLTLRVTIAIAHDEVTIEVDRPRTPT
jgi:hypothetical protein